VILLILTKIKKIWTTKIGKFILYPIIRPILFFEKIVSSDKKSIEIRYKCCFGREIDWDSPQTLNEKINWRKIYDHKKIYTICSDKYAVRDYVKDKIGEKYLIPLIQQTEDPEEMDFKNLPENFIIKANNSSGDNIIVFDKKKISQRDTLKKARKLLSRDYYASCREHQYAGIKPRILVEKLLLDKEGKIPADIKFHCFGGRVGMIQVDVDRFENHRRGYYDKEWNLLPFTFCPEVNGKPKYEIGSIFKKPKNLREMIRIAQKLSQDFDYVRVDLYDTGDRIYFGELTFTHGAGYERFFPDEWDYHFGKMWKISHGD
jgi:hypothetical protein